MYFEVTGSKVKLLGIDLYTTVGQLTPQTTLIDELRNCYKGTISRLEEPRPINLGVTKSRVSI